MEKTFMIKVNGETVLDLMELGIEFEYVAARQEVKIPAPRRSPAKGKRPPQKIFKGDRVQVKSRDSNYPDASLGMEGVVVEERKSGKGFSFYARTEEGKVFHAPQNILRRIK